MQRRICPSWNFSQPIHIIREMLAFHLRTKSLIYAPQSTGCTFIFRKHIFYCGFVFSHNVSFVCEDKRSLAIYILHGWEFVLLQTTDNLKIYFRLAEKYLPLLKLLLEQCQLFKVFISTQLNQQVAICPSWDSRWSLLPSQQVFFSAQVSTGGNSLRPTHFYILGCLPFLP